MDGWKRHAIKYLKSWTPTQVCKPSLEGLLNSAPRADFGFALSFSINSGFDTSQQPPNLIIIFINFFSPGSSSGNMAWV